MRASPTRRASAQDREREPQVRFLEADVDHGLAAASGISPRHVRQLMQALADPSLDNRGGGRGGCVPRAVRRLVQKKLVSFLRPEEENKENNHTNGGGGR